MGLLELAARCRGRRTVEELIASTTLLLGHVMSLGQIEDVVLAEKFFSKSEFVRVLDEAPAKVFDSMSWSYWNAVFDRMAPEMPERWFAFKYVRRTGKYLVTAEDIKTLRGPQIEWI